MNIVLEGPDNAGKTTLARMIADKTGFHIKSPEGPCKTEEEILRRMEDYFQNHPLHTIFDRHPVISQNIYSKIHNNPFVPQHWVDLLYTSKPLIIYCRPTEGRGIDGHEVKDRDDPEDLRRIEENYGRIVSYYDEWAARHANMIYRIGDNMEDFCERALSNIVRPFDPMGDIEAFHKKFGLSYDGPPRVLPKDIADFRLKFMEEELEEYGGNDLVANMNLKTKNDPAKALGEMLDALVDLTYVVLGTSHLHGFDFREAWRRVHLANMSKKRAKAKSDSKRGSVYDVVKPEGWQPPNHHDLVEDHAHK